MGLVPILTVRVREVRYEMALEVVCSAISEYSPFTVACNPSGFGYSHAWSFEPISF